MSVLTRKFTTKHDTAPFSAIKTEDFMPAFKEGIEMARKEIDDIVANPEVPTFENTIAAMSYSGEVLERVSGIFFNLHSAETNDEIQSSSAAPVDPATPAD